MGNLGSLMTSFVEANLQTLTCEWVAKIKRDI